MGRRPLCVCLLLFLAVYLTICQFTKDPDGSGQYDLDGQPMVLYGVVDEVYEPLEQSKESTILYLKNIKNLTSSVKEYSKKTTGQNLTEFNLQGAVCYLDEGQKTPRVGAAVRISGTVYTFSKATNPGEFDMAAYYELRGYQIQMFDAAVEAESVSFDRYGQFMHELRMKAAQIFGLLLGQKNGALAAAMVLGRKKDIDASLKLLYQSAGISHILAISGLHVSLVGRSVMITLKKIRLPLWAVSLISMGFILLYGIFTGMSVSTLRAVVMFLLVMTAAMVYRTPDTITSLVIAATVALVQEPGYLRDSGFLLSFSAVVGMALAVPVMKDRGLRQPRKKALWIKCRDWIFEAVSTSLAVSLTMMPCMLSFFYTWNPWSLIWNPVAIFLTGLLLPQLFILAVIGMAAGKIGRLLPLLRFLALPAGMIFEILEQISALLQKLPGSCLHIGMPKVWQLAVFGFGLAALLIGGKKLHPGLRFLAAAGLIGIFLVRLPGTLTVTMLDVGQGAGFVVQTPQHQTFLFDAGSTSKSSVGQYQIVPYLKYCGVGKLDAVFISHWDEDHVNGLADILEWAKWEQVAVEKLILPDILLEDQALLQLLEMAESYGIEVQRMNAGDRIRSGKVSITCLHPYAGELVSDRNAASMALKLEWGSFSVLFPGDLEEEQENWICENYESEFLSCQLLAAAHHGSSTSSTERFLEAAAPGAVLISCGEKNRYGHPHEEVLERLEKRNIKWYAAPWTGAVTVRVKEREMVIETYSKG